MFSGMLEGYISSLILVGKILGELINDSVVIRKYEYWGKMLCAVIIYMTTFVITDSDGRNRHRTCEMNNLFLKIDGKLLNSLNN